MCLNIADRSSRKEGVVASDFAINTLSLQVPMAFIGLCDTELRRCETLALFVTQGLTEPELYAFATHGEDLWRL